MDTELIVLYYLPMVLSEEDVRSIIREGEDCAVAFFVSLVGQINSLSERVTELEDQLVKNSGNSSKPPSSDGFKKKPLEPMTTSLRKKSGKKVGGQPGHEGKTLEQVADPDDAIAYRPECCPDCQADLHDAIVIPGEVCRRQVVDIPAPKVFVTEHRALSVTCPGCGKACRGSFPEGVTQPVQYGANLLGLAVYLHSVHLVPFARCAQIMQEITGTLFSPSCLDRALQTAYQKLEPFEAAVVQALADVGLKHADETGLRVKGKLHWFHVRCTERLSHLFPHEKRGSEAADDLADYTGILVSDFWTGYVKLSCRHAFCGAHLLRELKFQHEVKKQAWAENLILLLEDAVAACYAARARGSAKVWDRGRFAHEYDDLVSEGLRCNPPPECGKASKAVNLLERLQRHKDSCLQFLRDLSVPFTNNEAERDLRMLKVKGKISGGFRTTEGARRYCRLRSYTATCRKQDIPILQGLRALFRNELVMPRFVAE